MEVAPLAQIALNATTSSVANIRFVITRWRALAAGPDKQPSGKPMRVGCLWWYEVIGERERALTVLRRVCDKALVCFCALERATLMAVLGNAARRSDDQRG